jgi:1,4-alpha-glucan branching enzyme
MTNLIEFQLFAPYNKEVAVIHQRVMVELGNRGIVGEAAFKRVKLGAILMLTAVGIPMLWMGEEFGDYNPLNQEANKIDWT